MNKNKKANKTLENKTAIYLTDNRDIVSLYEDLKIYKKKYTCRKTGKRHDGQFTTKRKSCPVCVWKYVQCR